jgi:hypothetical protein
MTTNTNRDPASRSARDSEGEVRRPPREPSIVDTRCAICGLGRRMYMCTACCKSYERHSYGESTVIGAIVWAARRSRRFAIERERLRTRLSAAGLLRGTP